MGSSGAGESKDEILVVDVQILSFMLSENGYNVEMALSGKKALEVVRRRLPDLILLDINMPGMSGYDVCEKPNSTRLTE